MKKCQDPVKESSCYVQAEQAFAQGQQSRYLYSIYLHGNFVVCDASEEDMRNLQTAIQQALEATTPKGGKP